MDIKKRLEEAVISEKTLRDEFAMSALTGLLSDGLTKQSYEFLAQLAYRHADAMLEARKQ